MMKKAAGEGRRKAGRKGFGAAGVLLLVFMAASCDDGPPPETTRAENAVTDQERQNQRVLAYPSPLTPEAAVEYALGHNLETMLLEREQELNDLKAHQSWLKLLPSLEANGELSRRSDQPGDQSVNLDTGERSSRYSSSTDKTTKTFNLSLVWNILDFGVGYFAARQEGDRSEIAKLNLERTRQNVALKVTSAYWNCLAAEQSAAAAVGVIAELEVVEKTVQQRVTEGVLPQAEGLRQQTRILESLRQLREYSRRAEGARGELARLMGLEPGARLTLGDFAFPRVTDFPQYDAKALADAAIMGRPELYQKDLEEKIALDQVQIALLKILPSPSLALSHDWDGSPFLYASSWYGLAVKAAWSLLDIPGKIKDVQLDHAGTDLVRWQRLAQAVAVLTQVELALIQYHAAAESCVAYGEVDRINGELQEVAGKLAAEGRADGSAVLQAKVESFFSAARNRELYAEFCAAQAKLKNSIGLEAARFAEALPEVKRCQLAGSDGLEAAARQLSSADPRKAVAARQRLLEAGEPGAAAALTALNSGDQIAQIMAIGIVRQHGTPQMIASLLPALSDQNPQLRFQAALALQDAFGRDLGYRFDAPPAARAEAIARWREFLFGKKDAPLSAPVAGGTGEAQVKEYSLAR